MTLLPSSGSLPSVNFKNSKKAPNFLIQIQISLIWQVSVVWPMLRPTDQLGSAPEEARIGRSDHSGRGPEALRAPIALQQSGNVAVYFAGLFVRRTALLLRPEPWADAHPHGNSHPAAFIRLFIRFGSRGHRHRRRQGRGSGRWSGGCRAGITTTRALIVLRSDNPHRETGRSGQLHRVQSGRFAGRAICWLNQQLNAPFP